MKLTAGSTAKRAAAFVLLCLLVGCTTRPTIDWAGRMGVYTYDQAVMDYGPPDRAAELSDKSRVVEWVTRKGGYQVNTFGYGYGYYGSPYPYRPYPYHYGYAAPYDVSRVPDRGLRLVFDPAGVLKGFNEFSK